MFKQQKARTKHKFIVSPEELVGIPIQFKRVKLTIAHKSARKTYATQEVAVVPGAEGAPATAVFSSGDRKPLSFTAHLTRTGDGTIDAPVSWAPKYVELTLQGSTQEAGGTGVFAPWRNWEPIAVCDVDLTPFASNASSLPPGKYQSTLLPLPWPSSSGVYQQAKIYARSGLLLSINTSAPPSPSPRTPTSTPASARGPNKQGDIELASAAQTAHAGVSLPPSLAPSVNGSRRASMEHVSAASSVTGATSDEDDEPLGGQQLPYVRAASSGEAASGLREPHATPHSSGILKDSNAASGTAATADSSTHTPSPDPDTSGHGRSNFLSQVIRALSPSPTPSRELRHSLDLQVQQSPQQQQQQQQAPADVRRSLDLQPQAQSAATRRSFDLEPQPRHFMAPAPSMEPGQSLFGPDVPAHALSDTGFSSSGSGNVSSGFVTSGPTFTTEELRAKLMAAAAQDRNGEDDEHAGGFDVQSSGAAGSGLASQQEVAGVAKLSPSASSGSSSSTEGSAIGRGVVGGSAGNLAGIAEVDEAAERSSAEYSQRASAEFAAPTAAAEAVELPPAAGPLAAAGAAVSVAASNLQSAAAPAAAAVSAAAGKAMAAVGPMAAAAGTAVSSAADKALSAAGPMASSVASAAGPAAAMIVAAPMAAGVAVVGAAAAATGLAAAALADTAAGVGSDVAKPPTTALGATEAATATPISEVQAVEDTTPLVETDSRPFAVPETLTTHAAPHAAASLDMADAAAAVAAPADAVLTAPADAVLAAPADAVLAAPADAVLAAPAVAALAAPVPTAVSSEIEPLIEPAAAYEGMAAPALTAHVAADLAEPEALDAAAPAIIGTPAPVAVDAEAPDTISTAAAPDTFTAAADAALSSVSPASAASTAAPVASDSTTPAPPSPLKIDSRHDYGRIINRLAPTSKPPPSPKHSPSASPRADAGAWPSAFAQVGLLPSQLAQQQQGLMPEEGQQKEQEVQRGKRVLWGEDGEQLKPVTGAQQANAEQLPNALPQSIEQEEVPLQQQQQEVQQGSMEELLENALSHQQQEVQQQQQQQQQEEEVQQGSLDQLLDSELARQQQQDQQQEIVPSRLYAADDDKQLLLQQQEQQQQQPQVRTEIKEAEEADANDRQAPTPPMLAPARQSSDAERSARLRSLADQYNRQLGSSHSSSYSSSLGSPAKASVSAAAAKQGAAVASAKQDSALAPIEQGKEGPAAVILPLVGAGPEFAGFDGIVNAAAGNAAAGNAAVGNAAGYAPGYVAGGAAGYAPGYVAGGAAGYAALDATGHAPGQAAAASSAQQQLSQGSWSSSDTDKLSSKWDQDWEMGARAAGQMQGPAARLGSSSLYDTAKQYNASLAPPASATGALKGAAAAIADNSTRAAQMVASAVDMAAGATSTVAGATYAVAGSVASVAGAGASVGAAGASTALHLGAGAAQGAGHAAIGLGWAAIGVAAWGTATAIHSTLSVGRWALGMDKTDGADSRADGRSEQWRAQEAGRGSSSGPSAGVGIGDSMWASGDQAGGAQAGGGTQAGGAQGHGQDTLPGAASLEYEGSEAVLQDQGQQFFAADAPFGGDAAAAQGSRSWWWPALPGQQQQEGQQGQGLVPEQQEQGAAEEEGVLARAVGALPRPLAVLLQPLLWYIGFIASMVEFGVRVGAWLAWLAFWWLTLPVRVATVVAFAPLRLLIATWDSIMRRVQTNGEHGSGGGLEGDLGWIRQPGTEGERERQAFNAPSNGVDVLVGRGRDVVEAGAGGDGEVGQGQQSWLQWARQAAGVGNVYRRVGWAQTRERAV